MLLVEQWRQYFLRFVTKNDGRVVLGRQQLRVPPYSWTQVTVPLQSPRIRGEMLLKRDPTIPTPAEAAFGRAIEIAGGQGTRSFGLRAALSLAKLYQSTARPADANAVLEPALEGFARTPEMPEIAEAQVLLKQL